MNPPAGPLERSLSGGLPDVVGMILDKGIVVDAFARVSLVGIEVLTVEAKIVVSSIDTYLRYAEAMAQLDIVSPAPPGLPQIVEGVAEGLTAAAGAVQQAAGAAGSAAQSVAGLVAAAGEPVREGRL